MNAPPEPPTPVRSFVPIFLATIVLTTAMGILSFLTLGFFGVIVGVAIFFGLVIAVQYVIWGRWLSQYLAKRDDTERQRRLD